MTKEQYIKMTEPLRKNEDLAKKVCDANQILTGIIYCVYPLYLITLFLKKNPLFLRSIIVPGISFVLLTLVRRMINAPRPYEKFETPPVIDKDTQGKSFPSRHVFSIFVIGMTIFVSHPGAGIMIGVLGIALAIIRVIGGVHEPKDVVAGALSGILCGIIGFYVF